MSDMHEIEISIEQAQEIVAMRDSLARLENNADYKKIFIDGYFHDEVIRMVDLISSPTMVDRRDDLVEALAGVSLLKDFLRNIARMGDGAEQQILQLEEIRDGEFEEGDE